MTSLLSLLRKHEGAVEADLSRFYGLDYRDRWRRDEHGRRRLTVRMILVRVRHLPPDSAVAVALGQPGWTVADYLIADLFHATGGKRHPSRPTGSTAQIADPVRERKLRSARARARARQRAIARGEL